VKRTELQAVVSRLRHQHHPAAAFSVTSRPDRNSADFELVDLVVHGNESVNIIIEAQRKLTVNFSSFHLLEMEKFDNCALSEFHLE
jgi:hypothetical protein